MQNRDSGGYFKGNWGGVDRRGKKENNVASRCKHRGEKIRGDRRLRKGRTTCFEMLLWGASEGKAAIRDGLAISNEKKYPKIRFENQAGVDS